MNVCCSSIGVNTEGQ